MFKRINKGNSDKKFSHGVSKKSYPVFNSKNTMKILEDFLVIRYTICPGSRDSFYTVTYYIKWVTTS